MRIYLSGQMVRFADSAGSWLKSLPLSALTIEMFGANGLILQNIETVRIFEEFRIDTYNVGDPNQRLEDGAGVIDANLATAIARLETFIGEPSGGSANTILQTTAPIAGGSAIPLPTHTISIDTMSLLVGSIPLSGDEWFLYYDVSLAAYRRLQLNQIGNFSQNVAFVAQTSVNVIHSLGVYPTITLLDVSGIEFVGTITHNSTNDFTVTFTVATTGLIHYAL
jgi:hypothetical protein